MGLYISQKLIFIQSSLYAVNDFILLFLQSHPVLNDWIEFFGIRPKATCCLSSKRKKKSSSTNITHDPDF